MTDSTTLNQAHQDYLNHLEDKGRAHATILAYGKDVDQLIKLAEKRGLVYPEQVTPDLIEDFKQDLKEDGYTSKSISRKINSIKSFFRFIETQFDLETNPADNVSHPKIEATPPRILTKVEYRALRDACRNDERIYAIVEILLQTGIRISELADLTIDDVANDFSHISIKSERKHEQRKIPLNRSAAKALEAYVKVRPETRIDNLFVTKTGRPFLIRNIRAAIDRYFKLAGIDEAKVNDLRHTFIAEQLAAGTPLIYVSKLVGHKRLTTTEKYLKFLDQKLEKNEIRLQEL